MENFDVWQIAVLVLHAVMMWIGILQNQKSIKNLSKAEGQVETQLDLLREQNNLYRRANADKIAYGDHVHPISTDPPKTDT